MSFTTSARLSRGQYVVAIAGATSVLGQTIVQTLLSPQSYGPFFSRVLCLVDGPSSPAACKLADQGASIHGVEPALKEALSGVDALIDAGATARETDMLFEAAIDAGVPLYFPGGFAQNHTWTKSDAPSDEHTTALHRLLLDCGKVGKIKIVQLQTGMVLEDYVQSPSSAQPASTSALSVTSQGDLARALAELVILWGVGQALPDRVRVAGCVMGEEDGKSSANDNELVNPGERCWKWATVEKHRR